MRRIQTITPCLWFDDQAEEAARLYTGIFPNSRIIGTTRYGEAGREIHGRDAGTVMTVAFELDGQAFTALNGGPRFSFNAAISLQVHCETQEELDHYWHRLCEGGDERAQQCGWLKDRYGVSWQVVPVLLQAMLNESDPVRTDRLMNALLKMRKLDPAGLERAWQG
jgi:predicted 3-demethylubiquinone-9 3-methyltransferase (glyoxalase superfamily)